MLSIHLTKDIRNNLSDITKKWGFFEYQSIYNKQKYYEKNYEVNRKRFIKNY